MVGVYLTFFFKQFFNRKYPSVFQSGSAIYIPAISEWTVQMLLILVNT